MSSIFRFALGKRVLAPAAMLLLTAGGSCASPPLPRPSASTVSVPPGPEPPVANEPERPAPKPVAALVSELIAAENIDDPDRRWLKAKKAVEQARALGDPRNANALSAYLERGSNLPRAGERAHFETGIAFALAELGDVRALPALAERLRHNPLKIYSQESNWEASLRRHDRERIVAARLIGDLAVLHPAKLATVREQTQAAIFAWLTSRPAPHANGLRALARMKTQDERIRTQMRAWADPKEPLPRPGAQPPFSEAWASAQIALRYVGALRDEKSWSILKKQIRRRPARVDASMDALVGSGNAILGMTLRALGSGTARGFSEWGDPRAFAPLLRHAADAKENEDSRREACAALPWVARDSERKLLVQTLQKWSKPAAKARQFRLNCLLEAMSGARFEGAAPVLLGLLDEKRPAEIRSFAARALGRPGFDATTEQQLVKLLSGGAAKSDAALALLLGGSTDGALRAARSHLPGKATSAERQALSDRYYRSFGAFLETDLDDGHLFRWVENAVAVSGSSAPATPDGWARDRLAKQFDNLNFDNGPHTLTRVVLRHRLSGLARTGSGEVSKAAIRTLELMQEKGSLLALSASDGRVATLARASLARLASKQKASRAK